MAVRRVCMGILLSLLLLPARGRATTYYVDNNATRCPACSDSNTCAQAQTISTGRATINKGIACLAAGDTLEIRGGSTASMALVYAEHLHDTTTHCSTCTKIPSGGGSYATATTIRPYNGEYIILRPPGLSGAQGAMRWTSSGAAVSSYIVVGDATRSCPTRNFIVDGSVCSPTNADTFCGGIYILNGSHHLRFTNLEIKNFKQFGTVTFGNNGLDTFLELRCSSVHDNGPSGSNGNQYHNIYITSDDNLIESNEIYRASGANVHVYASAASGVTTSRNIIRQNWIHHNGAFGAASSNITIANDNNQIYNNLVTDTAGAGYAISVQYGTTPNANYIANNTIYSASTRCIYIRAGVTNTTIANNICAQSPTFLTDETNPSTTVQTTNVFSASPGFVNPGIDFHLLATSPAVDAGTSQAATFTTDYAGTPRTGTWDIGAYTFEATTGALHLTWTRPPSGGVEAVALAPSLLAAIQDEAHVLQDLDTGPCTLSKASGPGTLGGTLSVTPVDGLCTFADITLSAAGTYTLSVARSGTTSATTGSFVVTAPDTTAAAVRFRFR